MAGKKPDAIHGGEPAKQAFDAVPDPIVQTSTYTFANSDEIVRMTSGESAHLEYGRYDNPTCRAAEKRMAALEGTDDALIFASGMAALSTAVLAILKQGQHVVLFRDCYRMSRELVVTRLAQYGVASTLVEPGDIAGLEKALRPDTRLVISEAPTNPYLRCIDLDALAKVCKGRRGLKTLVDSTFATPMLSRPAEHGIDLVVHSATKYIGGHHDVLAGFVCGNDALVSAIRDLRGVLGSVCDPHAAFLVSRGMKTLSLRVERASASAMAIASRLERHPKIARVWYPGLASHPDHPTAARQMRGGFGGVVSVVVEGGFGAAKKFVDGVRLAKIGPSFGGPETLIEQPAIMSFYGMSAEERAAAGIEDGLVRLAVGLEDADDLVSDLEQSLNSL